MDLPAGAHLGADGLRQGRLDVTAPPLPIDRIRPDQRCGEHQDDENGDGGQKIAQGFMMSEN